MIHLFRFLCAVLACAALAGCTLPRGAALHSEILKERDKEHPTFQVVPVTRAALPQLSGWPHTGGAGGHGWITAAPGPESTIIRAGDRIGVIIWDSQDNSLLAPAGLKTITLQPITVSPTGTIFLPYVNEVLVRGLTPTEARNTVQQALTGIAPTAQVQLNVEPGQSNTIDVVTGVPRPGTYPLPSRNTTILSAIAQSGGIIPGLRNPVVRLIRDGKTFEVSAERLFSEAGLNTTLRGQDKILIEQDPRYFTALGATGTERLIYFDKEDITALEAMSMIGGLNDGRANPKGVLVLREYSAGQLRSDGKGPAMRQVVFTFDMTTADGLFAARSFGINAGDTVLATESPVAAAGVLLGIIGSTLGVVNSAEGVGN